MTESILFGEQALSVGDQLAIGRNDKRITILDITQDAEQVYVVVKYGNGKPVLLQAEQLVYALQQGVFSEVESPKYEVGNRYVHQFNNTTVEILYASPIAGSSNNEFAYFVSLLDEDGTYSYGSVEESYFESLVPLEYEEDELPVIEIPEGTELPPVIYVKH